MARQHPKDEPVQPVGGVSALRDWKCVLLLGAIVAAFFYKILLGTAWLWEDMMYFSYPVRVFAATSVAMGHLPLWNPFTFNGMPFLADIQTTVLYLPCLLLSLCVHDGSLNFYWLELMVIAHYVLAGWAMYVLASGFNLKRAPAFFAGVSYMLSGFMIAHAIHQQIITMVAWFPLIIYLFRSALLERRWQSVFACALILGHSTFAGYPQLSLYLHFFLLAYFVFILLSTFPGKTIATREALFLTFRAGTIVVLGLAIAAIQLLPTAELADLSMRAEITYEKSTEGTLAVSQLLTVIFPKLFGSSGAAGNAYWGPGTYWYYWETCIYLGALPLMLALLCPFIVRRNRTVIFFSCVSLFALAFALGNNLGLQRIFFDFVPGFSKFRNPARMGILLSLSVSVLSAFSLQELLYGKRSAEALQRAKKLLYGIGLTISVFWLALVTGGLDGLLGVPKNPEITAAFHSDANVSFLFMILSFGVLRWLLVGGLRTTRAALIVPALFFFDMYVFGGNQNSSAVNPTEYFHRADPITHFLRNDLKNGLFRVNTRNQYGMIMDRNQGMFDRILTMEGYTPLVLQRAVPPLNDEKKFDLLNVKYKTIFDRGSGRLSLALHPTFLPHAFLLYDVRIARSEKELLAFLGDSTWDHRRTVILESTPPLEIPPLMGGVEGSAQTTSYQDNRVEVEIQSPGNGILVLSDIFYPGWRASIDGVETEVLRADYNLRAVAVPGGRHTVVFQFASQPFARGMWISIMAAVGCLFGISVPMLRSKRQTGKG